MSKSGARRVFFGAGVAAALAGAGGATAVAEPPEFDAWLAGARNEALSRGLPAFAVDETIGSASYLPRVIELDRRQPEFVQTFWRYFDARITEARVAEGQALLAAYQPMLDEVYARWGVPARILVALWGLESDFGRAQGETPVASAVSTLAYDGRRAAFFREQLMALIDLVARGDVAAGVRGSWAGAIGQAQFMPTTYRDHAQDGDGDGRRDLQGDVADVFASAANYLAASGWDNWSSWGHEVALPAGFDFAEAGLDIERPLTDWRALGVTMADGTPLPDRSLVASVLLPAGSSGPAFIVYRNFRTILSWNNSVFYALAVGHLADRLAGAGPLLAGRAAAELPPLSRQDVIDLQQRLAGLGFEPGEADGVVGQKTQRAIRAFQKSQLMPADGYPDPALLARLRSTPLGRDG